MPGGKLSSSQPLPLLIAHSYWLLAGISDPSFSFIVCLYIPSLLGQAVTLSSRFRWSAGGTVSAISKRWLHPSLVVTVSTIFCSTA